ncbi:MAG TPA: hypothetical protein VGD31_04155 [Sphingobacteriaceae bacterium]
MSKRTNRIHFYSVSDMAAPQELQKIKTFLTSVDTEVDFTVNDFLEFAHIAKYFDNNLFLTTWSKEDIQILKSNLDVLLGKAISFWLSLDSDNIVQQNSIVDFAYKEAFWETVHNYKIYKKITTEVFNDMLAESPADIRDVLSFQKIVNYFSNEIRLFLLSSPDAAELLLSNFEVSNRTVYIFPKCLSDSDKEEIIVKYIESDDPNLNYLRLIVHSRDSELKLSTKTKLKAKIKEREINDSILASEVSTSFGVQTGIKKDQDAPVIISRHNTTLNFDYGLNYLESVTNDIELFELFKTLFGYVNDFGLFDLVTKENEADGFEKAFMRSRNEYFTSISFQQRRLSALSQLLVFEGYLKNREKTLEGLIATYINHLRNDLGFDGLQFSIIERKDRLIDNIRSLLPELEFLLKQFQCFATEGYIDFDLIRLESQPLNYSQIKSLFDNKYAYERNNAFGYLKYSFFSRDAMFHYIEPYKKKYSNLFHLLYHEKLKIEDFESYQRDGIEKLIQEGHLQVNSDGLITITDIAGKILISLLYKNEVISYWHLPNFVQQRLDEFLESNLTTSNCTLFTHQETSYLNFCLNKKEFTNGMDLRNKYLHGTNSDFKESHERDYQILLIITILIILKISDELKIKKELSTSRSANLAS